MPTGNMDVRQARVYVSVVVAFDELGRMIPKVLLWEDGRKYDIERLLDVRPGYAARAGGQGDRYTVRIEGKERYLFFEHNAEFGSRCLGAGLSNVSSTWMKESDRRVRQVLYIG